MNELSPHFGQRLWNRPDKEGWIFRGQREAKWNLAPSAHRKTGDTYTCEPFRLFIAGQRTPWAATARDLIDLEESFAMKFASLASHYGLQIPTDRPELRDRDYAVKKHSGKNFPPIRQRFIYALAQHYGVPTRLLDWTWRPQVAAYFAAIGWARDSADPAQSVVDDRLAVWAVSRGFIDGVCREWNPGAIVVTVETTSNPNLRAQQGLFTLVRFNKTKPRDDQYLPALDELLTDPANIALARSVGGLSSGPMLYKFTLPHGVEARKLLHFLDMAGVNAASIFPGYASIMEAMKEGSYRTFIGPDPT